MCFGGFVLHPDFQLFIQELPKSFKQLTRDGVLPVKSGQKGLSFQGWKYLVVINHGILSLLSMEEWKKTPVDVQFELMMVKVTIVFRALREILSIEPFQCSQKLWKT